MKPVTQTAGQPDTPFWKAVESAFLEIDSALPSLPEDFSLACILAGGAAVHLYTQIRVSDGIDAAAMRLCNNFIILLHNRNEQMDAGRFKLF